MSKKNIEIVEVKKPLVASSTEIMIQQAIDKGASVEVMEKLFALFENVKASQAKAEFVKALATFQANCPVIKKTNKVMNKDGVSVRYQFAPLDGIIQQIKKPLYEAGLSYTWAVKNDEGFITAVATITHELGHTETSEFKVPIDKEGFMTAPQKYASALTFAKRYSLTNALGISTSDEDTDATDVGKEKEPKSEKSKIVFLLKSLGEKTTTKEQIVAAVTKLAKLDLVDGNFGEIITRLEVIVKEQNENNEI